MEIKIQAIKFDATAKLQEFIQKRLSKLDRFYDGISTIDVTLKVVKPETSNNKEAEVKLIAPHLELFADKISDSFEQSVDECADALQRQLIKAKEKK
ncbi:MAG: ribosome-associated translation inhibitor RaiA [Paludibacteraceae bacterium]|nr:ribosome-associated translation inhibitor RaiA [Paludibacteraceae bacterium]